MKDVYWFKHDANARRDQKMVTLRLVYGAEGYGWFWMLIELMREDTEYKLKLSGKHTLAALAKELDAEAEKLKEFIKDCIEEFNLFESDGKYFWSKSLLRRMEAYNSLIEKRRDAANTRWGRA